MNASERLMAVGLRLLRQAAVSGLIDRVHLRGVAERLVRSGARNGFRVAGAANRGLRAVRKLARPARFGSRVHTDLFDPRPDEEQRILADATRSFALGELRTAAAAADSACEAPQALLHAAAELGIASLNVPEALGGAAREHFSVGNTLVTEALAQGDAGLAVACLAPVAVANALTRWGSAEQQAAYLPAFAGDDPPSAALAVLEPRPLCNPFKLEMRARRSGGGYVLDGVKTLVPRAAQCELFVVAAMLDDEGPRLFIVESGARGLTTVPEPAMGLRAATTARVRLERVVLPAAALLDTRAASDARDSYTQCVQLARVAWCALGVGVAQAALDYVIPYVNERKAFGEPISQRQAVAFTVSDMAIELESMRLLTRRAASRAEQVLPFAREAALARQLCAEKGMAIGSAAIQLLGGHGFVKDHPVERWYRDLRAIGLMEGVLLV